MECPISTQDSKVNDRNKAEAEAVMAKLKAIDVKAVLLPQR